MTVNITDTGNGVEITYSANDSTILPYSEYEVRLLNNTISIKHGSLAIFNFNADDIASPSGTPVQKRNAIAVMLNQSSGGGGGGATEATLQDILSKIEGIEGSSVTLCIDDNGIRFYEVITKNATTGETEISYIDRAGVAFTPTPPIFAIEEIIYDRLTQIDKQISVSNQITVATTAQQAVTIATYGVGALQGYYAQNTSNQSAWLKFYSKAGTINPASDVPIFKVFVPGTGTNGGVVGPEIFPFEIPLASFTPQLQFRVTRNEPNTDNTAPAAPVTVRTYFR